MMIRLDLVTEEAHALAEVLEAALPGVRVTSTNHARRAVESTIGALRHNLAIKHPHIARRSER